MNRSLLVRAVALALTFDVAGALFGASVTSAPLVAVAAVLMLDGVIAWCVWPLISQPEPEALA